MSHQTVTQNARQYGGEIEMEATIEKLKQEALDSWDGQIGEERAEALENYLRAKITEYADALGISQNEILESWEKHRTYSAINYYQECNQPSIKGENVRIFDTVEQLSASIGEREFRCPYCKGVSSSPYVCVCGWKVYGLLADLGNGVFVYVKDQVRGELIFMPISWEKKAST